MCSFVNTEWMLNELKIVKNDDLNIYNMFQVKGLCLSVQIDLYYVFEWN